MKDLLGTSNATVESIFVALADTTRLSILSELGRGPAASASALANRLPISRQAIAKHLATLVDSGLATGHQHGREIVYEVCSSPLLAGAQWLTDVARDWDSRLAQLQRRAESTDDDSAPTI